MRDSNLMQGNKFKISEVRKMQKHFSHLKLFPVTIH